MALFDRMYETRRNSDPPFNDRSPFGLSVASAKSKTAAIREVPFDFAAYAATLRTNDASPYFPRTVKGNLL